MFFVHTMNQQLNTLLPLLYEKYGVSLKRMAYAICKNNAMSEDAVQQTFERLIKYPESILKCEIEHRHLILFTICKHEVFRLYRVEKRESEKSQKLIECVDAPELEIDDNVLKKYIHKESVLTLKEKILKLDDYYSLPLILYELSGMKLKRIAKIMDLSVSGVRKRILKARKMLADSMREEEKMHEKQTAENK